MKEIDTEKLLVVQIDEFRSLWNDMKSAEKFTDKLRYALYPPGWNHIDGGVLADELREAATTELGKSAR